jgi:hypothetical protein
MIGFVLALKGKGKFSCVFFLILTEHHAMKAYWGSGNKVILISEADHSPPSSAKVKNPWSYTSTSPIHLHGLVLRTLPP